jgi:hypothetical protein
MLRVAFHRSCVPVRNGSFAKAGNGIAKTGLIHEANALSAASHEMLDESYSDFI